MENNQSPLPLAPYAFARCLHTACPHADECLHRLAALTDTACYPVISLINPLAIPGDGTDCSYFRSTRKIRMAWGIRHLLDDVPARLAPQLKRQLLAHFGRSRYYRFYRDEACLSPDEQEYVCQLFRQYGIGQEPAFDRYTYEYNW